MTLRSRIERLESMNGEKVDGPDQIVTVFGGSPNDDAKAFVRAQGVELAERAFVIRIVSLTDRHGRLPDPVIPMVMGNVVNCETRAA